MSDIVIKAENISKQYRLGQVGTGSLSHDMNRLWHTIRGKEDPYLKIGEENDRTTKGDSEYVWALRDINFEVKHGEVLGIIGRNGAGKSTLLKILSRTTTPTTGNIKIKGRVASLLEVGTGFHPELSGRDNIFLNGAILGMTKGEIKRKFDEIVDFAGVEKYIDTPVKRYSSGMYVRLAFGVAAHLEPEILIVDEVLAVGDAEFQKKALGKMKDVSTQDGRTVLFVSHNLASVQNLCQKGIYLSNGLISFQGEMKQTIDKYLVGNHISDSGKNLIKKYKSPYKSKIASVSLHDVETEQEKSSFKMGEDIRVQLALEMPDITENINVSVRLNDVFGNGIAAWRTSEMQVELKHRTYMTVNLIIEKLNIFDGDYNISVSLSKGTETIDWIDSVVNLTIIPSQLEFFKNLSISKTHNLIYTPAKWFY